MTNQASLPLTTDYFNEWTKRRALASLSSNVGSPHIPFQNWRRFKEAFTPELVARAVLQHPAKVERILDPFSGSGTTALACQFLGITPIAIEVNPYLADLTEAKLATYNAAQVARAVGEVTSTAHVTLEELTTFYQGLPSTFIEPGEKGRWIFSRQTAGEILQLVAGIERITDADIRRLLRVLLGAVLIDVSNITVSGKGRRYRRGWEQRDVTGEASFKLVRAVGQAVHDITRYSDKKLTLYNVLRGDARTLIHDAPRIDLAIYSPPYPNSFDYTDVYNVELWMLRYFKSGVDTHRLRQATL